MMFVFSCLGIIYFVQIYAGTNCDNNINDCPGNCSATNTETDGCEDLVDDYRCHCKVGFTGKDCEVSILPFEWW